MWWASAGWAWAQASGYGAEQTGQLAGWLCGYDLVVNTVPTLVLGEAELADLKPDCLVLDLASKPGGVDLEAAGRLGRTVIWALSLPGKVAPSPPGPPSKTPSTICSTSWEHNAERKVFLGK